MHTARFLLVAALLLVVPLASGCRSCCRATCVATPPSSAEALATTVHEVADLIAALQSVGDSLAEAQAHLLGQVRKDIGDQAYERASLRFTGEVLVARAPPAVQERIAKVFYWLREGAGPCQ